MASSAPGGMGESLKPLRAIVRIFHGFSTALSRHRSGVPATLSPGRQHGAPRTGYPGTRQALVEHYQRRQAMQTTRCTRIPGMTLAVLLTLKGRNDARSHTTPRAPRTQTLHIPYERRTNMKRVSLWMIGIGLFITVGLITVEQGYAEEKDHAPTCTLETLKGRYLFGGISTLLPPAFGVTQQSLASSALSS